MIIWATARRMSWQQFKINLVGILFVSYSIQESLFNLTVRIIDTPWFQLFITHLSPLETINEQSLQCLSELRPIKFIAARTTCRLDSRRLQLLQPMPLPKPFFDVVRHQILSRYYSDDVVRFVDDDHVTETERPEDDVCSM